MTIILVFSLFGAPCTIESVAGDGDKEHMLLYLQMTAGLYDVTETDGRRRMLCVCDYRRFGGRCG